MKDTATKESQRHTGIVVMVIGGAAAAGSYSMEMGSLSDMGPGYYPFLLGLILFAIGALICINDFKAQANKPPRETTNRKGTYNWRPPIIVSLGVIAFLILGKYGGLVPATFSLLAISAQADQKTRLKEGLLFAFWTTIATVILFHYVLQLQFRLFTWG